MFLTIKRSNISDCLTPLIMPSGYPCRGTALPCPDGCREAMPEAPKSHFLKGGLSACKRYPFGLQKTTFCEPKDGLLESPEKQPFATAAVCRRRMRPRFRQKYLTAKKQKQHKPQSICPQQQNTTQRAKKAEVRTKKPGSEKMRRKGRKRRRRKNHAAAQTENKAAATPRRTHIIYIAHNAPKTANKR
jgi:hypothetical protein